MDGKTATSGPQLSAMSLSDRDGSIHEKEDSKVKTVEDLCNLYYKSVGHNATMLLNFPVNKDGLIHPIDSANAVNFHGRSDKNYRSNLLKGITPKIDSQQGKHIGKNIHQTANMTPSGLLKGKKMPISSSTRKTKISHTPHAPGIHTSGAARKAFSIYYQQGKNWVSSTLKEETTTIGYKRILRFDMITTSGIRIVIDDAKGCPCINYCFSILITRKKYENFYN